MTVSRTDDATIVTFRGSAVLDLATSEALAAELLGLANGPGPRVIVDFTAVRFLASRVLGLLVELTKKAEAAHGQVVICGLEGDLHKVFKVTRLDRLLTLAHDMEDALRLLDAEDGP